MNLLEIQPISEKVLNYNPDQGALALSDVNLVPRHTDIKSRYGDQIDTSTVIANGLTPLNIPTITAGMDTVTEAEMAITFALNGGLGEIHRNNIPEAQAEIVRTVKDRLRVIEVDPPKLPESATIFDANKLLSRRKRGYVVVYPGPEYNQTISGLATRRDFLDGSDDTPLYEVMTKLADLDTVPRGTTLEQAVELMKAKRREKVPVLDGEGKLVGMYSMKDESLYSKNKNAVLDKEGRLLVGAAIGVKNIDFERAHLLEEAGADVIFVDVAHGDNDNIRWIMTALKNGSDRIKIPIILGNFSPYSDNPIEGENVLYAIDLGADGIKIGIGPGKQCLTRDIAGTGVPQLTAILNTRRIMNRLGKGIPIIGDGGIRLPHDANVAIAAGADAVMIGTLFAGTSDSPGEIVEIEGKRFKQVRGMASKGVFEDRLVMGEVTTNAEIYTPAAEGGEEFIVYRGDTKEQLHELIGGLRSAMSYSNSHNIVELQSAKLVRMTPSGVGEHHREIG